MFIRGRFEPSCSPFPVSLICFCLFRRGNTQPPVSAHHPVDRFSSQTAELRLRLPLHQEQRAAGLHLRWLKQSHTSVRICNTKHKGTDAYEGNCIELYIIFPPPTTPARGSRPFQSIVMLTVQYNAICLSRRVLKRLTFTTACVTDALQTHTSNSSSGSHTGGHE